MIRHTVHVSSHVVVRSLKLGAHQTINHSKYEYNVKSHSAYTISVPTISVVVGMLAETPLYDIDILQWGLLNWVRIG